jgi:hypothetical protein
MRKGQKNYSSITVVLANPWNGLHINFYKMFFVYNILTYLKTIIYPQVKSQKTYMLTSEVEAINIKRIYQPHRPYIYHTILFSNEYVVEWEALQPQGLAPERNLAWG